jgi:nucleoid DNA-binding protein
MKPNHYTKRQLFQLVINKLKGKHIHKYHTISVINIFIDEMINELKSGNKIKIDNFATFQLNQLKPKMVWSYVSKKMMMGRAVKAMRIKLDKKLKKYLLNDA